MKLEIILSISAITISVFSLLLSFYVALRDRPNIKTESKVYKHSKTGEYHHFHLKVVNAGRRPVILTELECIYSEKKISGLYIGDDEKGIKLEEGEFYEYKFSKIDQIMIYDPMNNGDIYSLENIKIIDSSNKKHTVKSAKKNIKKLYLTYT
ncbi:MAG: hypothetical protein MJE63_25840 [Proteobacteria bacterium]|nr:hypothetical protein [Pseudomonadota bacterium]